MSLLKKENWFVCLIIDLFLGNLFILLLAYMMKLYDKKAWYCNIKYWIFGAICLFFPIFIMFLVFNVQMSAKVGIALEIPGEELYNNPYFWIICIIIPIIGWIILLVMLLYLTLWPIVMLKRGYGEKYID